MHKIFIDGSAGTTGLKIDHYLNSRDDIEILPVEDKYRKDISYRLELMSKADISFLCLPDKASEEIADLIPASCRIIDTATCHRINSDWVYGMAELSKSQRQLIAESNRVANPGCHASGFILGVKPLIDSSLLLNTAPLSVTSLTGYSGGGKQMIKNYESEFSTNLEGGSIYGLNQNHKHIPEMMAMTGIKKVPSFTPIVVNTFSGMAVNIPLHQEFLSKFSTLQDLQKMYKEFFCGASLIEVNDEILDSGFIYSNILAGSNKARIILSGKDQLPMVTVLFDNLGKGASGSAVQNMNLMLGIDETRGLI